MKNNNIPKIAIVFPGQGSQAVGMGKDLYDNFASAQKVFKTIDEILEINLSKICFEGPLDELTKTQNTQPALMAVSIALIEVMKQDFGKNFADICALTAGHSLGEYSALCASQALSLEDTAKLLQIRGLAMAECGKKTAGSMCAILGVEVDIAQQIALEASQGEACQIANDNSVGQIVLSGSKTAIERAVEIAKIKGAKRAIILPVSGAFHSSLMQVAQDKMAVALQKININKPSVPLVANVSASIVENHQDIKNLLIQQITGSVRWRETMLCFEKNGIEEVIEFGSGKVLSGLVSRTAPTIKSSSVQTAEDLKNFLSKL
jgi:[acyl-carrier-protein] S-malonyltransferase